MTTDPDQDDTKRLDWILANWTRRSRLVKIKNRGDIDTMMGLDSSCEALAKQEAWTDEHGNESVGKPK